MELSQLLTGPPFRDSGKALKAIRETIDLYAAEVTQSTASPSVGRESGAIAKDTLRLILEVVDNYDESKPNLQDARKSSQAKNRVE